MKSIFHILEVGIYHIATRGRVASSVKKMAMSGTNGVRFLAGTTKLIFPFAKMNRPVLGPTKPKGTEGSHGE
jgi:hypothetical protein